jgi:hypothetical protein
MTIGQALNKHGSLIRKHKIDKLLAENMIQDAISRGLK